MPVCYIYNCDPYRHTGSILASRVLSHSRFQVRNNQKHIKARMNRITNGALAALAVAAALLPAPRVSGAAIPPTVDLTANGTAEGTIGDVIFKRDNTIPTGTGVFQPFLTLDSPGNSVLEQGYNTTTSNQLLPLDDLRNHWNKNLQKQDLAVVNGYYVFTLDSNETGNGSQNRYLSIDNIRIYTSGTGSQTTSNPDALGVLRYFLNDPLSLTANPNWVKIDSTRNVPLQKTSGSGSSDMTVWIPMQ